MPKCSEPIGCMVIEKLTKSQKIDLNVLKSEDGENGVKVR
jgi:hypothetical protein